jgi:hypothetical protein
MRKLQNTQEKMRMTSTNCFDHEECDFLLLQLSLHSDHLANLQQRETSRGTFKVQLIGEWQPSLLPTGEACSASFLSGSVDISLDSFAADDGALVARCTKFTTMLNVAYYDT